MYTCLIYQCLPVGEALALGKTETPLINLHTLRGQNQEMHKSDCDVTYRIIFFTYLCNNLEEYNLTRVYDKKINKVMFMTRDKAITAGKSLPSSVFLKLIGPVTFTSLANELQIPREL